MARNHQIKIELEKGIKINITKNLEGLRNVRHQ